MEKHVSLVGRFFFHYSFEKRFFEEKVIDEKPKERLQILESWNFSNYLEKLSNFLMLKIKFFETTFEWFWKIFHLWDVKY